MKKLTCWLDLFRRGTSWLCVRNGHADTPRSTTTYRLCCVGTRPTRSIQCHYWQHSQRCDWQGFVLRRPSDPHELGHRLTYGLLDVPRLGPRVHSLRHCCQRYAAGNASNCGLVRGTRLLYGVSIAARAQAVKSRDQVTFTTTKGRIGECGMALASL